MPGVLNCGVSQINMPAILVANALGVCLMLVILLGKRRRMRTISYDGRLFYWMCELCLIQCILETLGFFLDGKNYPGSRMLSMVCSAVLLFLAAVLAFLWSCYVNYKLFSDHWRLRALYPILAIPAGVIGLMALANLFVDIFFGVSQANVYYRTPLFMLPWVVVYGYMAYGAVLSYRYRKQADKYLFMPVLAFLFPIILGSLIQMAYYGLSLIWVSVALGLTFLYINLQNEEAYLDSLTGLYNRSYLLHYMDHVARRSNQGQAVIGVMLDIDGFKQINDTCGHSKGDDVLRTVGTLLLRAVPNHSVVVRYGGDEFVILLEDAGPEQIQAIRESIRREVEDYNRTAGEKRFPLSLSVGAAALACGDVSGFFREMDRKMYEEKRAFYLHTEADRMPDKGGE